MDNTIQPQSTNKIPLLTAGSIIVVAIIITGVVLFARERVAENKNGNGIQVQDEQQVAKDTVTGSIGLSQKGNQSSYRRNQQVTFFVYADSRSQEVTGYDAVLRYNPEELRFESVKTVIEDIDILETVEPVDDTTEEVYITGVQSLSRKEPFMFENTALAEVTFTVLSGDEVKVDVVYEPGSRIDSNLLTASNQDIISDVVGTTITVR